MVSTNQSIGARTATRGTLVHVLVQILQEANSLASRITDRLNAVTHAQEPDWITLDKECNLLVTEFKRLAEATFGIKGTLEKKILELKESGKGPIHLAAPIPASSLQTVMMLHLVGEQHMNRRLEELGLIEKRRKDALKQLEDGQKMCKERFDEMANRLNLICYMRDCLKRDGVLPCNVMYMTHVPQMIASPFSIVQIIPKLQPAQQVHTDVAPKEAVHKIATAPSAAHDPEKVKRELEKRRALLLQMRNQTKNVKNSS